LLRCAAPSPLLLKLLKEFAKKSVRVESTLPSDVARYLYVLSALRARIHGIAGISTLTNASVAREASRCLTFAWLSDDARELLRSSLVEANKKQGGDATGGPPDRPTPADLD
jgi:hypothetical protein